jgi:hypothetical protein
MEKPVFKTGNKSFIKALNRVVDDLWCNGLNPAGRPGWSWSKDGWVPPYVFAGSESTPQPWDIIAAPVEDPAPDPPEWVVYNPTVVWSRENVATAITITNEPFVPIADYWLVAKIVSLSTPAIEILCLEELPNHPNAYEFTASPTYGFTAAHIPLWRFYDETGDRRFQIGGELFAEKLIQPYPSLEYRLVQPDLSGAPNDLAMGIDLR